MKRFQAEYSENNVTYWPAYEARRFGIIYFLVIGFIHMTISIRMWVGNSTSETRLGTLIAFPIVMVALCAVIRFLYVRMQMKIIVSNVGIVLFKNKFEIEKQIDWEDVSAVYFHQEIWRGARTCRIFLKKTESQKLNKKRKCDFILPVQAVNEEKLLQFIPKSLWQNHPWY